MRKSMRQDNQGSRHNRRVEVIPELAEKKLSQEEVASHVYALFATGLVTSEATLRNISLPSEEAKRESFRPTLCGKRSPSILSPR